MRFWSDRSIIDCDKSLVRSEKEKSDEVRRKERTICACDSDSSIDQAFTIRNSTSDEECQWKRSPRWSNFSESRYWLWFQRKMAKPPTVTVKPQKATRVREFTGFFSIVFRWRRTKGFGEVSIYSLERERERIELNEERNKARLTIWFSIDSSNLLRSQVDVHRTDTKLVEWSLPTSIDRVEQVEQRDNDVTKTSHSRWREVLRRDNRSSEWTSEKWPLRRAMDAHLGSEIDRHEKVWDEEKIVQPKNDLQIVQHVRIPSDEPGQGEDHVTHVASTHPHPRYQRRQEWSLTSVGTRHIHCWCNWPRAWDRRVALVLCSSSVPWSI